VVETRSFAAGATASASWPVNQTTSRASLSRKFSSSAGVWTGNDEVLGYVELEKMKSSELNLLKSLTLALGLKAQVLDLGLEGQVLGQGLDLCLVPKSLLPSLLNGSK